MKPVIIIAIAVVFGIGIGLSLDVSAEEGLIPSWIKNIALMFGQDQISDSEFIGALQYLVKEGILVIPVEEIKIQEEETTSFDGTPISWDYKDILRNEEYYIGKIIHVTGKIVSVIEDDEYGDWVLLKISTDEGSYGLWVLDEMYIWYDGSRVLRDDMIEASIRVDGLHSVESMYAGSYIYYPIGTAAFLTCTNC